MIKPTVGRVVHFHPNQHDAITRGDQPLAALVAYVHSDTMINVCAFDSNGCATPRTSVMLWQDSEPGPSNESHCSWMPYQVGQAAKTEALQAQVDLGPVAEPQLAFEAPASDPA